MEVNARNHTFKCGIALFLRIDKDLFFNFVLSSSFFFFLFFFFFFFSFFANGHMRKKYLFDKVLLYL